MPDQPQIVHAYTGMQIAQTRDHIQIVVSGEYPRGAKAGLRKQGFKRRSETTWEAPHTPMAIFRAQGIGSTFFEEE